LWREFCFCRLSIDEIHQNTHYGMYLYMYLYLCTGERKSLAYTIGIDLGGTKIAAALMNENGILVNSVDIATEAAGGPNVVMARMQRTVEDVMQGISSSEVKGVGIGAPGPLNPITGMVYSPPNLPGWNEIPLRTEMARRLQMDTFVDNDANAAALAEARLGAGAGTSHLVYVTVSTGIGGGVVFDGQIIHGSSGAAAEVGHMIVDPDGPLCPCGNHGCLEALASGTAIRRLAVERFGKDMDARMVAVEAAGGDHAAKQLLNEVFHWLGIGLINVVQMYDPEVIVVGGGVSRIGDPLFEALERAVAGNRYRSANFSVRVLPAKLGTKAGVIGAALLPTR
jgi:glucokinase